MSDFLNEDVIDFDNDASASSFGWNFQSNAGIFLFLHYIKDAESFKIESKLQDIEIALKGNRKILAQAKSSIDPSVDTQKKEKFKDAIISIAKTSKKEPEAHFIYISNESDTFDSVNKFFDCKVCAYKECITSIKKEIDETIESTIKSLQKKIDDIESKETKSNKDKNKKKKYNEIKELITKIKKENLFFSSIPRYFGSEQNRYSDIKNKVEYFLSYTLGLSSHHTIKILDNLFEHWHFLCEHNSTEKDICKEISKAEFIWPISVFLLQDIQYDIADCLSFSLESSLEDEAEEIFNNHEMIYHERFEFSNKVLQDYYDFRKKVPPGERNVEKKFVQEHGCDYLEEFRQDDFSDQKLEYVTKAFVYRIVYNSKNLRDICPKAGLDI